MNVSRFIAVLFLVLGLAACGGGGSSAPPPTTTTPPSGNNNGGGTGSGNTGTDNAVAITIDGGTDGNAFNEPFVSVTVCRPGTTTCQTIDHVLLDTGSFGLRLAAGALDASLALPTVAAPSGGTLAECAPFASGFTWGSVRRADVRIGGEMAAALPVQVVNDSAIPAPPRACTSKGTNFGVSGSANGILGVGLFTQDCGTACALSATPGFYYACAAGACSGTTAPLASQIANPVSFFATDNNGVTVTLPAVPLAGSPTVTGTLTFGVGTRANNALGNATVYATDASGNLATTFNGSRYTSFLDTGSNALFFPATLPQCSNGFYCPTSPQTFSAVISSPNGASSTIGFTIQGVQAVASTSTAAPIGGSPAGLARAFDWGLPFFFGRTVYLAIEGASTPAGPGPYWAF